MVLVSYWRSDTRVRGRTPHDPAEHDLAAIRITAGTLSPDGQFLLAVNRPGRQLLVPLQGGVPIDLGSLGHPEGRALDLSTGGTTSTSWTA